MITWLALEEMVMPILTDKVPSLSYATNITVIVFIILMKIFYDLYIKYFVIKGALNTKFIENNFQSRGISYDPFEKSIWSANFDSIVATNLIRIFIITIASIAANFSLNI
jgi:hypothetical protein